MDGVKLMANGIRLEKEIIKKENPSGKSTKKRSATHDTTSIGKDPDADVIIDATKGKDKGKKKTDKDESSVNRTDEQDTEKESEDTEKESDN